jgi:hypothetical protein
MTPLEKKRLLAREIKKLRNMLTYDHHLSDIATIRLAQKTLREFDEALHTERRLNEACKYELRMGT